MTHHSRLTTLTRTPAGNQEWAAQLARLGIPIYDLPCLETTPAILTPEAIRTLQDLPRYHWAVFTSAAGVRYFHELADTRRLDLEAMRERQIATVWPQIAAVGPQTAAALESLDLKVKFVPTSHDATTLAAQLPDVAGRSVLLLRTSAADHAPLQVLRRRRAAVTDLHLYHTRPLTTPDPEFIRLLRSRRVARVIFASPSAVQGFQSRVSSEPDQQLARALPALALGPAVAAALTAAGFQDIRTAATPTLAAIIELL